jgi:hypothetical protein
MTEAEKNALESMALAASDFYHNHSDTSIKKIVFMGQSHVRALEYLSDALEEPGGGVRD